MEQRKKMAIALMGVTLLAGGAYMLSGGEVTDQDRFKALIEEMAEDIEDRDVGSLFSHMKEGFSATIGRRFLDRGQLRMLITGTLLKYKEPISVALRDVAVTVSEDKATATLIGGLAKGGELKAEMAPDRAWSFEVLLEKNVEEDEWMIREVAAKRTEW